MTRTNKSASAKTSTASGDPFCQHGRTTEHCEDCRAIAAGRDVDGKAPRNVGAVVTVTEEPGDDGTPSIA